MRGAPCPRTSATRSFFFSSRRRHTRWTGDWSSDVCSSDLELHEASTPRDASWSSRKRKRARPASRTPAEIGRASCRERVENAGRVVPLKEQKRCSSQRGSTLHTREDPGDQDGKPDRLAERA